jgi:hypothetical protein
MSKQALDAVDEVRTYVVSPDGRRFLIGLRQDIPETLPTGERRYVRHTTLVAAANGSLIDPDSPRLATCQRCAAFPVHENATRRCSACEATVCLGCAVRVPDEQGGVAYICNACARRARRQALVRFFLSVP